MFLPSSLMMTHTNNRCWIKLFPFHRIILSMRLKSAICKSFKNCLRKLWYLHFRHIDPHLNIILTSSIHPFDDFTLFYCYKNHPDFGINHIIISHLRWLKITIIPYSVCKNWYAGLFPFEFDVRCVTTSYLLPLFECNLPFFYW